MKYGPSRGEWTLRLVVSVIGLGLLLAGLLSGRLTGIAAVEAVIIALVFFGGTAIWSARALIRKDHE